MITKKTTNQRKEFIMDNISLFGKIPPQAIELEEAVIGCLLMFRDTADMVFPILESEMFYKDAHAVIFKTVKELNANNQPVDILTVTKKLRESNNLEAVGGANYIAGLTGRTVTNSHVESYALGIKEKYIDRKILELTCNVQTAIYSDEVETPDVICDIEKELDNLVQLFAGAASVNHISSSVKKADEQMKKRVENARTGKMTGIDTGLADLNRYTNGWQNSELIILAGRPAMGKTAMLLHFAKSAVKNKSNYAAIFSLEMDEISLANRLILSQCSVSADRFNSGYLSNDELSEIEDAKSKVAGLNIYVDDKASVSMNYIRNKAKFLKKQGKCDIVFIDYLQLASETNAVKNRNREQEISQMSRQAKILAKDLQIPVILLSQLSREVEKRADKKPQLSDLRESGAIEQDADKVIFIYRPAYYGMVDEYGSPVTNDFGELIISKNRGGGIGTVKFGHNEALTQIYDYERPATERIEFKGKENLPY